MAASTSEWDGDDKEARDERFDQINEEVRLAIAEARGRVDVADATTVAGGCWNWTDHMRVNEWAVSLLSLDTVHPSRKLEKKLIGSRFGKVALPILNRALLRLLQENLTDKPTRRAAISVEKDMHVNIVGDATDDKKLCRAVVALYYHALEAFLYCESVRINGDSGDGSIDDDERQQMQQRVHKAVLSDGSFHRALLACCITCAAKAIGATHKLTGPTATNTPGGTTPLLMPVDTVLRICECDPYEFLKVPETFCRSLAPESPANGKVGSPLLFALPRMLGQQIKQAEVQCLDSLLWTTDQYYSAEDHAGETVGLCDRIDQRRATSNEELAEAENGVLWWPPKVLSSQEECAAFSGSDDESTGSENVPSPDSEDYREYVFISYLLKKVVQVAGARIRALSAVLHLESFVVDRARMCFSALLRHHVELLYDRHLDPWILCCLYGASKTPNPNRNREEDRDHNDNQITFTRILQAYVRVRGPELGGAACQRIVRKISLAGIVDDGGKGKGGGGGAKAVVGDVIQLYNSAFLPRMKDFLLKIAGAAHHKKRDREDEEERADEDDSEVNIRVNVVENLKHIHLARQKRARTTGAGAPGQATITF